MLTLNEINNATREFVADKDQIDSMFETISNTGKGNCLFFSFSQIFTDSKSQKKHGELRKQVCEFYKMFDVAVQYNADSIEEKIQMLMLSDDEHPNLVCTNYEWGTLLDIYTIAYINKVNVIIFTQYSDNPTQYLIMPIRVGGSHFAYLKYNTLNPEEAHYEAMKPKTMAERKQKKTPINNLVGETVSKRFKLDNGEHEYYIGTIISFNDPYYMVEYEDGDTEELTKGQINRILLKGGKYTRKSTRTRTRTRTRKARY